MAKTALVLCREVSDRMDDLVLCTATGGDTYALSGAASVKEYFPNDVAQLGAWVYGCADVVTANRGVERRARSWAAVAQTITFTRAWPAAITSAGTYELRRFHRRARVLEALNSAIGVLGTFAQRWFKDETLVGLANTWRYTLPSSQNWEYVAAVEIQANTSATATGYPYVSGDYLNWKAVPTTTAAGTQTWELQFASIPPVGRIIRVWGSAYFPDLSAETDTLALAGPYERIALEWIYKYAQHCLHTWQANVMEAGQVEEYRKAGQALAADAEAIRSKLMGASRSGRIGTPVSNNGVLGQDLRPPIEYLGAFANQH